jgi:hypothetical protein
LASIVRRNVIIITEVRCLQNLAEHIIGKILHSPKILLFSVGQVLHRDNLTD